MPCPGDSVQCLGEEHPQSTASDGGLDRRAPGGRRPGEQPGVLSGWGLSTCGQNPVLTNYSVIKTDFLCFKTLLVVCTDFPSFHKVENHEITGRGFEGNCP